MNTSLLAESSQQAMTPTQPLVSVSSGPQFPAPSRQFLVLVLNTKKPKG